MDTLRLPRDPVIRIERDHGSNKARILVSGQDVSRHVTAVSWSMQTGKLPTCTIEFSDVEIAVDAETTPDHPGGITYLTTRTWTE